MSASRPWPNRSGAILVQRPRSPRGISRSKSSKNWMTDNSYESCFGCMRKFNVFNRRHHCRLCGQIFCKSCSSQRVELSPDQGFVRSCDACYAKHNEAKPSADRPQGLAGSTTPPPPIPAPKSIFAISANEVSIALSFDDEACETSKSSLSSTLSCRCYRDTQGRHAVQCAHFHLSGGRRLRVDLQFQSTGGALFTVRLQTETYMLVGTGTAQVRNVPNSGVRFVDDFRVKLCNQTSSTSCLVSGSIAWKLKTPMLTIMPSPEGSGERRRELQNVLQSEITGVEGALRSVHDEESRKRFCLNAIAREVEMVKEESESKRRLSLPGGNLQELRNRRSSQWEAVEDLLSQRNQLQVHAQHLRLLQQCLEKVSLIEHEVPDGTALSCVCFRCFGTIIV